MIALLKYWRWIGFGLLLALLCIQTLRLSSEKAHSAALEATSALQVANYRAAYERSVADAFAAKIAKEKQYEAARQSSAATYASLSDRYRSAVLRLASAAHPGSGAKADLPRDAPGAGFHEAGASDPGISISTGDALKTADLAAYAMGCFEFAQGLETLK